MGGKSDFSGEGNLTAASQYDLIPKGAPSVSRYLATISCEANNRRLAVIPTTATFGTTTVLLRLAPLSLSTMCYLASPISRFPTLS